MNGEEWFIGYFSLRGNPLTRSTDAENAEDAGILARGEDHLALAVECTGLHLLEGIALDLDVLEEGLDAAEVEVGIIGRLPAEQPHAGLERGKWQHHQQADESSQQGKTF
jgi:hypothetical protein